MTIKKLAKLLHDAQRQQKQIDPPTQLLQGMTIEDSYATQLEIVSLRKQEGEKVIGMKVGLTSQGMQQLLGVDEPDYGHLTDAMLVREGEVIHSESLIQPKVEGEIAFYIKDTLKGPGVTIADVYNATEWIAPAVEIVDSRVKDWKITLEDTVADNGSSALLVLGANAVKLSSINMKLVGMTLEKNGVLIHSGTGAEVLGSPANAVAWLANKLSSFGLALEAGSIVLSGAITSALEAKKGDLFTVSFDGIESMNIKFD